MPSQVLFKAILLVAFAVLALLLVVPKPNTRGRAVRRLTLFLLLIAGAVFVVRPDLLTALANLVGIGRGTDLVLYALVVLVIGNMVAARRTALGQGRDITDLARTIAISQAPDPNSLEHRASDSAD